MESFSGAFISRRRFIHASLLAAGSFALSSFESDNYPDYLFLNLAEVSDSIRTKKLSPIEITQACLKRIEQLNPKLNAFITVTADEALQAAKQAENEIKSGKWKGPLHGIPIALKDNIDTANIKTTAASGVFANRIPGDDAEVVRKLKAAGAVIIGKQNMHECAHGTTSTISYFGAVHNPWNLDLIAGGSSGGSAAAVAAHMCYGAIGTDTGGSIRIPATCCGIVGLKPTFGLVSKRGVIPDSWSFDHVGPMCRTVADTAILLSVITGFDLKDENSLRSGSINYANELTQSVTSFRLGKLLFASNEGVKPEKFYEDLAPEISGVIDEAIKMLTTITAGFHDVNLPSIPDLFASVADAEAYSFYKSYLQQSPQLFQPATRKVLLTGQKVTASQYKNGLNSLYKIRRNMLGLFKTTDFLVTPTTSGLPPLIAKCTDPFQMTANTGMFNIYGLPAISIPCGFTGDGLPVGLQIAGPRFSEGRLLALAYAYEQAAKWYKKQPVL
jgi:aspartyl-tRNA(Asn)/glutamyl-tRNA(Gln) amidotransferase subunit A